MTGATLNTASCQGEGPNLPRRREGFQDLGCESLLFRVLEFGF